MNNVCCFPKPLPVGRLLAFCFLFTVTGLAQSGDQSVYLRNFVRHSTGEFCLHVAPTATFTGYLNGDQSKVLTENAARWDIGGDPNIDGKGTFGVELGNFVDPAVKSGDKVFMRFVCNATEEEGVLVDSVTGIPWYYFPQTLFLSPVNLPGRPQGIAMTVDAANRRTITWIEESGMTYSIYRRTLEDTLSSGKPRHLYTRVVENVSGGTYVDTTGTSDRTYAYIMYAVSLDGIYSSHSSLSIVINVPADQPTIQSGIDAASHGDTVLVQPGTYKENISFNGKNIVVGSLFIRTGDPSYISQTVIDGSGNTGNVSLVSFVNGEGSSAVLSGFTITNGSGGGITCTYRSSPSLMNLVVTGNAAPFSGGGIYCGDDSSPRLENVTISGNTSGGSGGGLQIARRCNPTLVRVTISGNSAQRAGGGILCYESSARLVNVTISGNTAFAGGAISCSGPNLSLVNTILWNNSPEEISSSQYSLVIAYCDVRGGESAIVTDNIGTVSYLEGNIDSDPLFVNAAGGDFHLQEGSPCIDAGTAFFVWGGETLVDLSDGTFEGSAPDIGAHEQTTVVLVDKAVRTPRGFSLLQNYPNPFNPSTTIQYELPEANFVTLALFDMLGREVALLVQEEKQAGRHVVKFNAEGLASGIYVYRIQSGRYSEAKKLLLLR